jgi:putative endonuclease
MAEKEAAFFVYILTNPTKTTLYIGVTNNLAARLKEHWDNRGKPETFAGKYYCYNLVYYEVNPSINAAIAREKELKKWSRNKKIALIQSHNPEWFFLNRDICKDWPPPSSVSR